MQESYASPQQRLSDFIPTESERQFFVYKYKTQVRSCTFASFVLRGVVVGCHWLVGLLLELPVAQVCVAAECSFCYNFHGHLER